MEAQKYVWKGAIPLQIHLHESEITTLPPPPPALVLAPRIGYLPLLASLIKPHFSSTLPPGVDTIWFEYKGLPLKWHIPTGVLFDLLCAEPERPWNITVHFRGYPGNLLIPCEGEESIKWSFINSLKEASYIIHGNCKNIMNMSQPDQVELWRSVLNGNLEAYLLVSSKLKLETAGYENMSKTNTRSLKSLQSGTDAMVQATASRIPIRLYVRSINDINNLEDAPSISSWDKVSYINRPLEIHGEEGKTFTLLDAVRSLLPEFFPEKSSLDKQLSRVEGGEKEMVCNSEDERADSGKELQCSPSSDIFTGINLVVRIQGIEPKMQIPFLWVVNNLMNPEHFLHISVFREVPQS